MSEKMTSNEYQRTSIAKFGVAKILCTKTETILRCGSIKLMLAKRAGRPVHEARNDPTTFV